MRVSRWRREYLRRLHQWSDAFLMEVVYSRWPDIAQSETFIILQELRKTLSKPDYNAFIARLETKGDNNEQFSKNASL